MTRALTLLRPLPLVGLVLLAFGCKAKVGELKTVDVVGDAQGDPSHPAEVDVTLAGGDLHVTPGGAHLVGGAVRSNVSDLDPVVTAGGSRVSVTQGKGGDVNPGKYGSDLVADWRLTLGTQPMTLTVDAGATNADLELGGLALKAVTVKAGAGVLAVHWSSPDTITADSLDVESGAGAVTVTDVGRMGASKVRVHSGAGAVTVSLGSKVDRDVVLDLESGVGEVVVKVPSSVTARADVKKGVGAVTANGWTQEGGAWVLGPAGAPPRVNITAHSGAGAVTLEATP